MEKKPERRLRDIWDAFTLLEQPQRASPLPSRRSLWVASALVIGLVIASWSAWRTTRPIEARLNSLVRLDVDLDRELPQAAERGADAILSPDGTRLLYVSQSRLFTRLLDQPAATELAGTEGAHNPFFSPDGQWIAFFTPGKLKKVSVRGGVPTTLCNTGLNSGGSWGEDGNIVAAIDVFGLSRIPSDGGAPTLVTELGPGEAIHRWPQVLPGGNAVLFAVYRSGIGVESARIEVLSLKDRSRKIVKKGGAWGRYLASGHLLYVEDNQVLVVPFDLNRMEMRGTPLPILPDVAHSALTGAVQLDCSRTGTIVYRTRRTAAGLMTVQWLDASGKSRPLLAKPGYYLNPRLSPDSERLVISSAGDIWVYEQRRDIMTRLTFTGGNSNPLWSADSRCIVFRAPGGMFWIRADGDGKPQALTQSDKPQVPWSFTVDGKRLAYVELNPATGADLWTVAVESDGENLRAGKPQVLLQTPFNERAPAFSPGGRWLAYASDETGTLEVYVRDLRHKDRKIQISDGGGNHPVWSADGNDLFFTNGDIEYQLMIARYTMQGDSLRPEKPRVWSRMRLPFTPPNRSYDVALGSQGVLALLPIDRQQSETEQRHIVFLQNFFDELRRREPYGAERQHRVIAEP